MPPLSPSNCNSGTAIHADAAISGRWYRGVNGRDKLSIGGAGEWYHNFGEEDGGNKENLVVEFFLALFFLTYQDTPAI